MNFQSTLKILSILCIGLAAAGCAPKIYVIDRQTVLEQEAAGEWPDFERALIANSLAASPTAFKKAALTAATSRRLNVLNGELVPGEAPLAKTSKDKGK